jgi:hypothetical protein
MRVIPLDRADLGQKRYPFRDPAPTAWLEILMLPNLRASLD